MTAQFSLNVFCYRPFPFAFTRLSSPAQPPFRHHRYWIRSYWSQPKDPFCSEIGKRRCPTQLGKIRHTRKHFKVNILIRKINNQNPLIPKREICSDWILDAYLCMEMGVELLGKKFSKISHFHYFGFIPKFKFSLHE